MEPKQISRGSVCDRLPPLSAKYPWFVAQNFEGTGEQIFYTIDKPWSHHRCRIPELIGRQIRAYFHGWAILSNHSHNDMWSLWNPLTSKLIRLPQLIYKHIDAPGCCLSAPPDDPSSIFLLTIARKPIFVFCRLDRKRKRLRWTEMSYAKQLRSISGEEVGFLGSLTCCNGKVYALTFEISSTLVMLVDIVVKDKEVVISISPFVKVIKYCGNRCPSFYDLMFVYSFLRGSSSELFYIVVGFNDKTCKTLSDLYLFKLDMTSMMWEEMEDLKDAIFFVELASYSVFYRPAVSSELGGYVHILSEMGKIVYSYHVKDRTISQSSMPSVVRESQVSAWALLEYWLEDDHASKQEKVEKDNEIVVRSGKGEEIESNSMEGESLLLNIPFHILENIMELCVGVEYLNFRATCKHCYLAAPPIQWSSKTTLRRLQEYSLVSPWLMVFDNDRCIVTFIDPLCGDKYFIKAPQQLRDYQIYCSGYGWLLMYKVMGLLAFFNPFTSDIHELPLVICLDTFCFSTPPTSPDCMVVGFTTGDSHVYIHFVAGEQHWFTLSLDFGGVDPYSFHFPTFYGWDVYALSNEGLINIFRNMGEVDYSWEHVTARASSSCRSLAQYYLAICDQHCLLVIVGEFGESVEVFNLNDDEELEKIDDIGNHVIFISGSTCLCIEAKSPEMKNKIYFSRLHSVNGKIVFYSLDTCKYHTFNGKNIQESYEDLLNTKHHRYPHTWIEPSWS